MGGLTRRLELFLVIVTELLLLSPGGLSLTQHVRAIPRRNDKMMNMNNNINKNTNTLHAAADNTIDDAGYMLAITTALVIDGT